MARYRNPEEPQVFHKDICIPFTVTARDGTKRRFEAVGFLEDGERSVTLEEACRRVGMLVVDSEEEWELIRYGRDAIPGELTRFKHLITKWQYPGNPGYALTLSWSDRDRDWVRNKWCHLLALHGSKSLILRRST